MSEELQQHKAKEKKKWKLKFSWFPTTFWGYLAILTTEFYSNKNSITVFALMFLGFLLFISMKRFPIIEILLLMQLFVPIRIFQSGNYSMILISETIIFLILIAGSIAGMCFYEITKNSNIKHTLQNVFINKFLAKLKYYQNKKIAIDIQQLIILIIFFLIYFNLKLALITIFILGIHSSIVTQGKSYLKLSLSIICFIIFTLFFIKLSLWSTSIYCVNFLLVSGLGLYAGYKLNLLEKNYLILNNYEVKKKQH